MTIFGQISSGTGEPEKLVVIVVVCGLLGVAIWQWVRWLLRAKPAPDPWDETVAIEIARTDAVPLCHHCLSPHSVEDDFCPDCGTPVGQYTNWLPFPQLFSIGHVLRTGTSGEFRRTPLTILGFLLFSFVEYTLFVPIYWLVFFWRIFVPRRSEIPPTQSPPDQATELP